MGSYSSGGEILPKQCSFVPHFRGSFSWLAIGSNTNIAIFVPLEALEAGVIPQFKLQIINHKIEFVPRVVSYSSVTDIGAAST